MDDLLPSLSSEDEHNHHDSDDDNEEDPVDGGMNDIQFGGILGEDGGLPMSLQSLKGWSYQTALDRIVQQQSNTNEQPQVPDRMDVASIIAAKRNALKKSQQNGSSYKDNEELKKERSKVDNDNGKEKDNQSRGSSSDVDDISSDSSDDNDNDDNDDSDDDDENDPVDDADNVMEQDVLKTRIGNEKDTSDREEGDDDDQSSSSDEEYDEGENVEAEKAAAFFDTSAALSSTQETTAIEVFTQLALSRPILRGIAAMGYVKPTQIQSSIIPLALAGRDICGSAVTGSGKTAAFLLPILERLLYRPHGRISCLILTPTRELAAQCLGMVSTLSQFTKITSALIVGGSKNMNAQMIELRARPQLVVATPGRVLDHVTNSAGVSLEDVQFLVLDEADRLLDLGFQDEVTELIKSCPVARQTLLFSATMNTKVDDLINLSLKRPVRVRISGKNSHSFGNKDLEVAPRLEQEFVRVRSSNEGVNREAMLLALLTRTFSKETIVFFDTKAKAHRLMILCGLCGIKCAELHGNLTQTQRLQALEQFRKGDVDILLATDLAARGLDISRVETVINFEMPNQVETYIHRIGRTARAGRGGKSCTLIGEGRRHLMKEIIKDATDKKKSKSLEESKLKTIQDATIRSRSIPSAVIDHFVKKIELLEKHVEEVLQAEAVARMDRVAEMEVTKARNIIEHSDEIKARPQKQWFATEKQKKITKETATEKAKLIAEKVGTGTHRMTRKKRRAREAIEISQENDEGENEVSRPTRMSIKKAAREHKREVSQKEKLRSLKSIHDEDVERARKKCKAKVGPNALGDSSLFGEEKISYASKQDKSPVDQRGKSSYTFNGFDQSLDGRKKGKQKAHHKFKSKSKYKRR